MLGYGFEVQGWLQCLRCKGGCGAWGARVAAVFEEQGWLRCLKCKGGCGAWGARVAVVFEVQGWLRCLRCKGGCGAWGARVAAVLEVQGWLRCLLWFVNSFKLNDIFNTLNAELNPISYLLALLAHHFLHVSRIRVKSLTLRLLMSYIYIYH